MQIETRLLKVKAPRRRMLPFGGSQRRCQRFDATNSGSNKYCSATRISVRETQDYSEICENILAVSSVVYRDFITASTDYPGEKSRSLVGTVNGSIMLADTTENSTKYELQIPRLHKGRVTALQFIGHDTYLTGGADGLIYLVETTRHIVKKNKGLLKSARDLMKTTSFKGLSKVHSSKDLSKTAKDLMVLDGHSAEIVDIIYDASDKVMMSYDKSGAVCHWDVSRICDSCSHPWINHELHGNARVVLPDEILHVDARLSRKIEWDAATLKGKRDQERKKNHLSE